MTTYTIGYEGSDIDRFVAVLRAVGVELLVDVRAIALSRKPGFSKSPLKARLADERISYEHLRVLGDPKTGREAARAGRYEEFNQIYNAHLDGLDAQKGLSLLADLVVHRKCCLMCFERDAAICHRSIISSRLRLQVVNLLGDSPTLYAKTSSTTSRRHLSQSTSPAQ
jgi:uncharacterized protein (DUF488 family)